MRRRELAGLILASALITLDGTAATVALAAIGHDLGISISRLQWISNAPLLVLASMLLPAGAAADRFGRVRVIRIGLAIFAVASLACMAAPSGLILIAARFLQGAGGALVLPAVLAVLRQAYAEDAERTRIFGVWAAWTGVASAAGPLLGGALVDLLSWRAVFVVSAGAALVANLLVRTRKETAPARQAGRIPVAVTAALATLLGATAYLLIELPGGTVSPPRAAVLAVAVAVAGMVIIRSSKRHILFPAELITARNCVSANAATFALYFGMFGLSFLLVLYTQQALGYSALSAALALLPVSLMLFFAERFGRVTARIGTRALIVGGALVAAAGLFWMAAGDHPLPFWSRIVVGTALFGLGVSLAVSSLTQAAISAVPERCAGAASALNHATVRAAGLVAIALLGSLAGRGGSEVTVEGFQRAVLICGVIVALGGALSGLLIRDEEPGGLQKAA